MFNYNHLYYFFVTARFGSVTQAAEHLRTSQSSLSTQLKTLEAALGRELFKKVGRHLQLTHDGQIVLGYCRRAFEVMDELGDFLNNSNQSKGPRISIGVTNEIERPFITDMIAGILQSKAPKEQPMIRMISATQANLESRLALHELDYCITNHQIHDENAIVVCEALLPIVLVGKPALVKVARGATNAQNALKSLDCGLVLPAEDLRLRHEVDNYIQKYKIKKNVVFESNILSAVTRAITDGVGVGFIPFPYVRNQIEQRELVILGPERLWDHKFFLVTTAHRERAAFTKEIAQQLSQSANI
jgi:LysR family transcriptional activator of nhaA